MENKPKHTPGPWTMSDGWSEMRNGETRFSSFINADGAQTIATLNEGQILYGKARMRHNAALIAAAPELLAACKFALAQAGLSPDSPTAAMLKATIAKAEGGHKNA